MGTHPPLLFPMAAAPNPSHSSPTKWNHMINRRPQGIPHDNP
ncbi:hypothetical protein SORBI_3002G148851 [Sorghum bicolor]|uniref:Uncharacterized protein n=1 Tax=Sorghum bicolor TaxID=4558 RepID=A0A1W0W445_SORBI|nr:hypothetical protein SORBI_3002G148851 [Sorghum bicolor]